MQSLRIHPSDPRPMRWELHGRMFGADLRIRPLFWVSCALLGVIFYQYPTIREDMGGIAAFGLWMAVVVLSMLAHELGHVLAARLVGAPVRIVVSGFGGQLFGLEELRRGRMVLIFLAGPFVNGLIFGVFMAMTYIPLPDNLGHDAKIYLGNSVWLFAMINAFWGLLNLLPLWPLDGGRIAVELGAVALGRRGQTLALLLSLLVTILLTFTVIQWVKIVLTNRFDPRYTIYFMYSCILALYCFAFWLSTFVALWGDPAAENKSV